MSIGMRDGDICNFFGCDGTMRFVTREWHELDRKIIEKCDLSQCDSCGVQSLVRSADD